MRVGPLGVDLRPARKPAGVQFAAEGCGGADVSFVTVWIEQ